MTITLKPGVLYAYRKAQNISRDELARRLGVASTTAWRIERGETKPSPKFIASLITVTGWEFSELFDIVSEDAA